MLAVTFLLGMPVNSDTATRVAKNFVLERMGSEYSVTMAKLLDSVKGESYIYVVNLTPQGFILVAADDAAIPVLGYSAMNNWGEVEIPVQLQDLLENWNAQLQDIRERNLSAPNETQALWSRYNCDTVLFVPDRNLRTVGPLLTTIWGQGTYYNAMCPAGCPVGCVATAMAQIMRYWSFPPVGSGSHSYNCPPYGTLSADFGSTTYNWAAMPDRVTSSNPAVATICYHAGVAVNMQYNPNGSGAYSQDVPNALITYFKYANTTQYRSKSSYSSSTWENMMKEELDNSRPIYYSGSSSQSGGHAFVLDGYQNSNFHINWGWNGSYNGYYALTALNPGGENFTSNQAAVVGIAPTVSVPTINEGFEGTTFPPTGWSINPTTGGFTRTTNTSYVISGTASAYHRATGNVNGKQLITPALTIDSTCPNLTFKAKRSTSNYSEQIKVGYSTSATGPWTYFPTNATLTSTAQTFSYVVNTLPYGTYYFVFETYSTNTSSLNNKTFVIDDIAGPYYPIPTQASINLTSWNAGTLSPGDEARSGNIFTLSNVGTGTLTVISVTDLSGTDFSTNFNPNISLVYGQIHDFGFTYEPLDYGSDNVNFQIVTNGGTINIALSGSAQYAVLSDGFENYPNFALNFPPWTQYDGDVSPTYSISGVTFPNQGYTGSFIIFNPAGCSPSLAGTPIDPHTGEKGAYCFAATTPPNNDWLISPQLNLNGNGTLSFWAKTYSSSYPEWFKVLYSTTTNNYSAFTNYLAGSPTTYIVAPTTWTQYTYTLPQNAKYFAVQCVSNDAFIFMVDDFLVTDQSVPPPPTFGNLSGYVYKYGTTEPIAGAVVTVGTKQCTTNPFGFYQINNILTGTVTAKVTAPGMFYHPTTVSGIVISAGQTTNQNFGLTWGELAANPSSVAFSLYQGETGSTGVTLSNPGGTANTLYAGYFVSGSSATSNRSAFVTEKKKPAPDKYGTRIPKITDATLPDRYSNWFSYASINDANYYSAATTERGNYFIVNDFALMDGPITISQLRHYFYSPSGAQWGTNYNKFRWKIYSVSPTGTVTNVHTSDLITLTDPGADYYLLVTYTLATPITIPAGYDFIVTVAPNTTTGTGAGRPQSLATDASTDHGIVISGSTISLAGLDFILDAYVNGTEWLTSYNFSGSIIPGGSVTLPLNFNAVDVSPGTKNAYMYIFNDANYVAPNPGNRGDMMAIPISLTVTVATEPVAVLIGDSWITNANVGSSSSSGNIFTLKNVGPGNLTISAINGLAGTPFTSQIVSDMSTISLAQTQTYSFGFTFAPTAPGVYTTTVEIVTNGGTKTISLKGYANYVAEGFEGIFPPDGWVIVDNDGDGYNWFQYSITGSTVAHTGTYCAASASYVNPTKDAEAKGDNSSRPALTPDNWLITPRLTISSGDELNYWIAAQDPNWPAEYYSVKLSTTNNAIASFTTTLFSETLADGEWHNRIIDLSDFAGESVYIAFQHHNCTDQFVLKLDDVIIPPLATPLVYGNITGRVSKAGTSDPVIGAIVSIAGRTTSTDEEGMYTFNDIVCDTYQLTVSATGYKPYTATVTIVENQTVVHNVFLNYAQFYTPVTTFNLSVQTGNSTSTNLILSNTGTAEVEWTADCGVWGGDILPAGPLTETFDNLDTALTGWTGLIGPNTGIYGSSSISYGYNSTYTWVFASYGTTQPQYIITPKLRVDSNSQFSFWYKQFNPSNETFSVKVSTSNNNIESFTQTLATIDPLTDTNWHQFNQSLAGFAGSDIYLCFYYPRTDNYQYGYVFIDEISGPTALLPPMEWLSVTPVSGTLLPGANTPVTLHCNASNLPVGYYSAQTWFFGEALNSPYKVYVNLNVTAPPVLTAPENVAIETFPGGISLGWDLASGANSYKVYGSNDPYGNYILIQTVDDNYFEITDEALNALGLSNRAFFKITADTAILAAKTISQESKYSSPLLQNYLLNQNKTLNVMNSKVKP